jgi:hypothetical protein
MRHHQVTVSVGFDQQGHRATRDRTGSAADRGTGVGLAEHGPGGGIDRGQLEGVTTQQFVAGVRLGHVVGGAARSNHLPLVITQRPGMHLQSPSTARRCRASRLRGPVDGSGLGSGEEEFRRKFQNSSLQGVRLP